MQRRFTDEELAIAKSVDLTAVAARLGYTVQKIGRYHTIKEMDSIRIYNRSHWYRWSRPDDKGNNGGSQIDFLRVFAGMDIKEAVFWLLDFAGYVANDRAEPILLKHQVSQEEKAKKKFLLPQKSENNGRLYDYLMNTRMLSREVIDYFVTKGLIYESQYYHDIVFMGNDRDGRTRFASLRGTDDTGGSYKCDVAGNDKRYGFHVVNGDCSELVVFEAAIDLMSYMELFSDFETNKLALGMLSDAPLETFTKEYPHIRKIRFCLDNDNPGRKAAGTLMKKYTEHGFETEDCPSPDAYKDYNEWLVAVKRTLLEEYDFCKNSR